jgi:hypothetical protein
LNFSPEKRRSYVCGFPIQELDLGVVSFVLHSWCRPLLFVLFATPWIAVPWSFGSHILAPMQFVVLGQQCSDGAWTGA